MPMTPPNPRSVLRRDQGNHRKLLLGDRTKSQRIEQHVIRRFVFRFDQRMEQSVEHLLELSDVVARHLENHSTLRLELR